MSTYEISQSSLLSLKAEILRKQEELVKVKHDNQEKLLNIKKKSPLLKKNKGIDERIELDGCPEDENLLKKSRETLEAKAKLYDKLSIESHNLTDEQVEYNKRYLVQFDKKLIRNKEDSDNEEPDTNLYSYSDGEQNFDDYTTENADEEWVEYVDALGRTRTCLHKDLEHIMKDDDKLRKEVEIRKLRDSCNDINDIDGKSDAITETASVCETVTSQSELESSDMRREMLRQKWEKEEYEIRNKSDIHYQDILFDEARSHGVGYYGFSKDDEERRKQQEALRKLRVETQEQQKKSQELRAMREKQLAARLKAARNRKRARMGLPPEEEEEPSPEPTQTEESKPEEKEPEVNTKELELEEKRKKHVRPWDIGKEGVPEHYEMTQEEWVDKQRKERPSEFAPPLSYRNDFRSQIPDESSVEFSEDLHRFENKQSSSRKKKFNVTFSAEKLNKRTRSSNLYKYTDFGSESQSKPIEPVPIVNECEDVNEECDRLLADFNVLRGNTINCSSMSNLYSEDERGRGTEIAPPSTFEYYGPSDKKQKSVPQSSSSSSLEDSINAGLHFLRREFEKKGKSTKHPDEIFLM